jgi:DNA polymerase-3 subunit alpha
MDKVTIYISDAKRFDIEVFPPDVNESLWQFNVVGKNIRFGMGAVKNVGEGAVLEIIRERSAKGPFKGFVDFCERINLKLVNKRVFESLIKVGAFDSCEKLNRKSLLDNIELVTGYAQKKQEAKLQGLVGLFDIFEGTDDSQERLDLSVSDDFTEKEKLGYEVELMGIYVSGHPLDRYMQMMKQLSSMPINQVQDVIGNDKREITLSGLIGGRKNILTKKGDKMAFLNLEDLTGKIECVVFPRVLAEFEELLTTDEPLIVIGEVNLAEAPRKFLPRKFFKLKQEAEDRITGVRLNLKLDQMHEHHLNKLKQTVMGFRGAIPIHLVFETNEGRARLPLGEDFLVNPSPQMAAKLNEIFNDNVVKFVIDGRLEDGAR